MSYLHPIRQIIETQKSGQSGGITSYCTAHPQVIETGLQHSEQTGQPILIEATCNQVNQFGGYTGMRPVDYVAFITSLAANVRLRPDQLILGGDHLGPSPWQTLPATEAMKNAEALVSAFVLAGFRKIHLDASMHLADDDPQKPLPAEVSTSRAARLAAAAEAASQNPQELVYVIGTEVPVPGGAKEHHGIQVTTPDAVAETIEMTRLAFIKEGLESAWQRVIAVVVQPGVEFGDDFVVDFDPPQANTLASYIETLPGMVYEAHSTDYQTVENLHSLVQQHFAILKVGPELTYAYREAVFLLAQIEKEYLPADDQSHLVETIEAVMLQHPADWQKYYRGSEDEQRFARKYSLSDRMRYYWPQPEIRSALERMQSNLLRRPIPLSLLSQYFPIQYEAIRSGQMDAQPDSLIKSQILRVIQRYGSACGFPLP